MGSEAAHRGRQRKTWRKVISELLQLNLDSQETLTEDYNVNSFLEIKHRDTENIQTLMMV